MASPRSGATRAVATAPTPHRSGQAPFSKGRPMATNRGKPRAPKTAAITVTCPAGEQAAFMRSARENIKLADLGITGALKARKALTGALLLEVPGADAGTKADALAGRLRALAEERGEGFSVRRPTKVATLRIRGVDDSLSKEEIAAAIAEAGACQPTDISVGQLRQAPRGQNTVLARCPLAVAIKVAAGERIRMGWVRAGVELLAERPLFCYKCLEQGHVRSSCRSPIDRGSCCYKCGVPGHRARDCAGAAKCPVCEAAGRPSGHRLGGPACKPPSKSAQRRRRRGLAKEKAAGGGGAVSPQQTAAVVEEAGGSGGREAPQPPTAESQAGVERVEAQSTPVDMEVEHLEGVE